MANARRLFGIATAVAHALLVFARAATDVGFNARAAVDVGLRDCPAGADLCGDPRMMGLRGQRISFSGTDGGWYCLFYDGASDIVVNIRLTAPRPEDFPGRQLVTGLSVASEGHSLTIEVRDPRRVLPGGCPYSDVAPCLANGGLRVAVDGEEADEGLLRFSRHEHVAGGISVSAANLPVECREFGADRIWARMYGDRVRAQRRLSSSAVDTTESFEAWIRAFGRMAALDWCVRAAREAGTGGAASGGSSSMLDPPAQCLELGEELLSFYESYGEGGFAGEPRRGGGGGTEGDDDARFEEWILSFGHMAAPDWCARYVAENGLADVQSTHAVFRISTPTVTVRLVVGVNHQAEGEAWEGRALPDLEFWQMNVGLLDAADLVAGDDALLTISGLLGETARPVCDEGGSPIMEGPGAFRGAVEDYRVSDALGADFALLKEQERRL